VEPPLRGSARRGCLSGQVQRKTVWPCLLTVYVWGNLVDAYVSTAGCVISLVGDTLSGMSARSLGIEVNGVLAAFPVQLSEGLPGWRVKLINRDRA
jgi:hypothetical protein